MTWRWVIANLDLRTTNTWSKSNFIFSGFSLCYSTWQLISNPGKHSLDIFAVAWSRKLTVSTIPLNQRVPEKLFSIAAIQGFCCKWMPWSKTHFPTQIPCQHSRTQEHFINWVMCFQINWLFGFSCLASLKTCLYYFVDEFIGHVGKGYREMSPHKRTQSMQGDNAHHLYKTCSISQQCFQTCDVTCDVMCDITCDVMCDVICLDAG